MLKKIGDKNQIQKNILSEETNHRNVEANETMYLYYKFSNKEEVIDSVWEPNPPFEYKQGREEFIPFFNLCLESMSVGEKSKFEFYSEEYEEDQILEIWLIDSKIKPKEKWDYTPEERFEIAVKTKEKADNLFRSKEEKVSLQRKLIPKDFSEIIRIYKEALDIIDWDTLKEIPQLKTKIRNNISLCYYKINEYDLCVTWAKSSLEFDKNNFKGHLRMSNAYVKLKQAEKARKALNNLIKLNNKTIQKDIVNLNKIIKELELKEEKIHQQIMAKTGKKLKESMSYCECNYCVVGNFESKILRYIKKDKIVYQNYTKALADFEEFQKHTHQTEKGNLSNTLIKSY
jgi:hypothetical protein